MSIIRLYTGDDGQTHIEELSPESHPELTELQSTTGIVFRSVEPGYFVDWHTAPRRQFVITLSGEVEIGLGRRNSASLRAGPRHSSGRPHWAGPHNPRRRRRASGYRHHPLVRLTRD